MEAEAYAICKNNKCKREVYTAEQVDELLKEAALPVGSIFLEDTETHDERPYGQWQYIGNVYISTGGGEYTIVAAWKRIA